MPKEGSGRPSNWVEWPIFVFQFAKDDRPTLLYYEATELQSAEIEGKHAEESRAAKIHHKDGWRHD